MKNVKEFQERYQHWKNGERYWDIRGIDLPKYDNANKSIHKREDGTYYSSPTNEYAFTENVTPILKRDLSNEATWDYKGDSGKIYKTQYTDDMLKNAAMQNQPSGEFYTWTDLNGNKHREPRVIGVSAVDPIGRFAIESVLTTPVIKSLGYAGNNLLTGIARDFRFTKPGAWLSNKLINRTFSNNIKRFDGTVSAEYFNSPYNWYRYTETPEIEGIREVGKNVTTTDAKNLINVPSNNWRMAAMDVYSKSKDGYWYKANADLNTDRLDYKLSTRLMKKYGSAHGNRTQASYGIPWNGATAQSGIGQSGILEGEAGNEIPFGITRSNFQLMPREKVQTGSRIGFRTGEMPMNNLSWFTQLQNGRFKYEGQVLPYKRIELPQIYIKQPVLDGRTYQIYTGPTHRYRK